MRRDQRASRGGCEPDGDERRRARDEAVEQDGKAIRGGAQHEAGKHRDLEPADRGEDAERVGGIRRLQRERTPDRLDLARESVVVESRSPSADGGCVDAEEDGGQRARRRRVADAHLADPEQVDAVGGQLVGELDACDDSRDRLVARHGRPGGEAHGARAEPQCPHRSLRNRSRDTRVDDDEPRAGATREDVDRGAAGDEVGDHLRGHLLRIRRDALGRDAVIRRDDDDRRLEVRARVPADRRDPARELLEATQTAARLRLRVEQVLRLPAGVVVRCADPRDRLREPVRHRAAPGEARAPRRRSTPRSRRPSTSR